MDEQLDTRPLRDQRHMIGPVMSTSLVDVEVARATWVATNGYAMRRRNGDWSTDERPSKRHVACYVSAGKWIADCPACKDGIAGWPFVTRGVCLGCGTAFHLDYPSRDEILTAVAALAVRPADLQHWRPHEGETAAHLHDENKRVGFGQASIVGDGVTVTVGALRAALGNDAVDKLMKEGVL